MTDTSSLAPLVLLAYSELTLTFPADLKELGHAGMSARAACLLAGCPEDCAGEVELALVEVLNNIVLHGVDCGATQIRLALHAADGGVSVTINDDGAALPAGMYTEPAGLGELEAESGRGAGLVQQLTDSVEVQRGDGWNRVLLTRRWAPGARARPLLPTVTEAAILDAIESQLEQIPPLPSATREILRLMSEPDAGVADMEACVCRDPVIAARVLRLAQSAFYGQQQASTLSRAIVVVGFQTVGSLALATSTYTLLDGVMDGYGMTASGLWQHSLACASVAAWLARRLRLEGRLEGADEAYTAALLHDIGKLLVAPHLADRAQAFRRRQAAGEDTADIEHALLATSHVEAGALLARRWGLPAAVAAVIRHHHAPSGASADFIGLTRVVRAADAVALSWGIGLSGGARALPEDWLAESVADPAERAAIGAALEAQRPAISQLCAAW